MRRLLAALAVTGALAPMGAIARPMDRLPIRTEEASCPDGRWEIRGKGGVILEEGLCREGRRIGHWVFRLDDGTVEAEGDFLDGVEDGRWFIRTASGEIEEGEYRGGERVGTWTVRDESGRAVDVRYAGDAPHLGFLTQ